MRINLRMRRLRFSIIPNDSHAIETRHVFAFCQEGIKSLKLVVEDAAQAIESFYKGRLLGSFGNLSSFSFHETRNIISGEGGMLVVNNENFIKRAEIIWEKGTNRSAFFRGEVDEYSWIDIGSSFLPSDILAAFLFAQLEYIEDIQRNEN
jgi:dTDP-4-amino-4,6-dideoxygalactose transaminase